MKPEGKHVCVERKHGAIGGRQKDTAQRMLAVTTIRISVAKQHSRPLLP